MTWRSGARIAAAVTRRPALWTTALRQWRRTVAPGWWHHRPFLPLPPAEYLRFRLMTQYGAADHPADAVDVVNYLAWCRLTTRGGDP